MLERIYWLLEIISLAICISSIYGVKIKADIKTVAWIAIEVMFMGMFKRNLITMQTYFIIYVLYILYVYIEFRMSLKIATFTAILSMIFTGLIQMIIALPVYYIGDYCKTSENIMVLVINAGVLMAVVLISKTKFLHGVYKFLARKELILNITFILVMFIYGYCMYRIKYSNKIQSDLYVIIVTFASIIACILLRWKAMERETEYQQEQIKLSNRYSEEYNALVEISRKKQHDFKNQINALYGLSDIKAEKEQRKYIDKLLDENKVVKILHSVEQPVLAGFLYRKVNEIMAAGINIEFNLSVPDAELAIEVLDCIEIEYGKKKLHFTTTKTINSVRDIPMMADCKKMLKLQKKNQNKIKKELGKRYRSENEEGLSDLVFTSSMGSAATRYNVAPIINKIVKSINLREDYESVKENRKPIYMEPVSPHALRRTFCTRCFEAGMNIKVVQKIMGHSNYAVTANTYTEVMPDKMNEEVELFNSKLLTM